MITLFVEQLTVVDCAYLDPQRGVIGESWIVDVELEGDLDAQSMILDFEDVKTRLKRAIEIPIDHALLVPMRSPLLSHQRDGDGIRLQYTAAQGLVEHVSPRSAVRMLPTEKITVDSVSAALLPLLRSAVPPNVKEIRIKLRHEATRNTWIRYAHGLKKLQGPGQRIAHGHRSRIEFRLEGQRVPPLEREFAATFRDVYIGTMSDVRERRNGLIRFSYTAADGYFELAVPEHTVILIENDSTIECIAQDMVRRISQIHPGIRAEVRAYEGMLRGAVATNF